MRRLRRVVIRKHIISDAGCPGLFHPRRRGSRHHQRQQGPQHGCPMSMRITPSLIARPSIPVLVACACSENVPPCRECDVTGRRGAVGTVGVFCPCLKFLCAAQVGEICQESSLRRRTRSVGAPAVKGCANIVPATRRRRSRGIIPAF